MFPPEEEGDDTCLVHGDGDEEDLDRNECRIARWAEEDSEIRKKMRKLAVWVLNRWQPCGRS